MPEKLSPKKDVKITAEFIRSLAGGQPSFANSNVIQKSSKIIILIVLFLVLLGIIAIATTLIAQDISKKAGRLEVTKQAVSPTPGKSSLYRDLPETFPRDIPLISRSKVTVAKDEESAWAAVLLTSLSYVEVESFYLEELEKAGWVIENKMQTTGLTIFNIEKEGRESIIAIGKSDEGVTVSITILKKTSQ